MSGHLRGHDQATAVPDQDATAALAGALSRLRLQGAIFLRGEYTEAWEYESMPPTDAAALLAPGSDRVILFHVIAAGRCWIEAMGGQRHWAQAGDVIVLPYGDAHRMGGVQDAARLSVPVASLIAPPPWSTMPVIRHGEGGEPTHVMCGYLTSDDPLFDPQIRALPPVFVVSPPSGAARDWVKATIEYAVHQTTLVSETRMEAPPQVTRLLLVEVLKLHFEGAQAVDQGWVKALHDPVLAPALTLLHGAPERKWTVGALASAVNVSTSLLDERFRAVLGKPPIRYLTSWRMHLARELLTAGDLGVAAIARRVGYESEEAFSRAFKREHGSAPSAWRTSATT